MKTLTKKILLIEDEKSIIFALTSKFNLIPGITVFYSKNGEEGLDLALKEKPDLILLDIILPKMDGLEMLKKMRQDPWGKNAKVIILSNLSNPDKETEAKKMGVKDYIIKANCKIEDVAKRVKSELKI